jgi:hypothetical protein
MGNLFSNESESQNKIVLDASNNSIETDASGNIIKLSKINLLGVGGDGGGGGFNPLNAVGMLAPIDKFGNRVRR